MIHRIAAIAVCVLYWGVLSAQVKKNHKERFSLTGKMPGMKGSKMYLEYRRMGNRVLDSSNIENGRFSFSGIVNGPTPSTLFNDAYDFSEELYLENENMKITRHDSAAATVFTGSATEDDHQQFKNFINIFHGNFRAMEKRYRLIRKTDSIMAAAMWEREADSLRAGVQTEIKHFIRTHPKSPVSAVQLAKWSNRLAIAELDSLYASLDKSLQKSSFGVNALNRISIRKFTEIGSTAYDFTMKDQNGKSIQLKSFRGKYVLLDFWASWCVPCRAENPNVVKAYERFKINGFEILGISLDYNETNWIKAIEKDQLLWTQVSDLKGWSNEAAQRYGVNSIPTNFLLNPLGVIIAKNLRGEELQKKLEALFTNGE